MGREPPTHSTSKQQERVQRICRGPAAGRSLKVPNAAPALIGSGGGPGEPRPSLTSLSALFCLRYEEEVSLRATAENEFVALKKVSKEPCGSTDARDLRTTAGPQRVWTSCGYLAWPSRDGRAQRSGLERLIQVADAGRPPWDAHVHRALGQGPAGLTSAVLPASEAVASAGVPRGQSSAVSLSRDSVPCSAVGSVAQGRGAAAGCGGRWSRTRRGRMQAWRTAGARQGPGGRACWNREGQEESWERKRGERLVARLQAQGAHRQRGRRR